MRKFFCLIAGVSLIFSNLAFSGVPGYPETIFGPHEFVRSKGKPETITIPFSYFKPGEDFLLIAEGKPGVNNTGFVYYNGEGIFELPVHFHKNDPAREIIVPVLLNNEISVRMVGKPGSSITITIYGRETGIPVLNVEAEENFLTNNPVFDIIVTVEDESDVETKIFQNGIETLSTGEKEFSFSATLQEGLNNFEIIAVDEWVNISDVKSLSNIILDTTPPILSDISPEEGSTLTSLTFEVSGESNEELSGIKLNGNELTLAQDRLSFSGESTAGASGPLPLYFVAVDSAGNPATFRVDVEMASEDEPEIPDDPVEVAPPLLPGGDAPFSEGVDFLYTGDNPIQTGVEPGAIEAQRVSVIRGKVLDESENPLSGVTVSIFHHEKFGKTVTREDGVFDLAVNGGGSYIINYFKDGYISAQRVIPVSKKDYVWAQDILMSPRSQLVSEVNLPSIEGIEVVSGEAKSDEYGDRQPRLMLQEGAVAKLVFSDESKEDISGFHIRITEFPAGIPAEKSFPGSVKNGFQFLYGFDLSIDEAEAAGAKVVEFNEPVAFYVEDLVDLKVGQQIFANYYDRETSSWMTSDFGLVVQILGIRDGRAVVSFHFSGEEATEEELEGFGLTASEREQLAELYPVGKKLFRIPVRHFTFYYLTAFVEGERIYSEGAPIVLEEDALSMLCEDVSTGLLSNCGSQVARRSVGISGVPFKINYVSSHVRKAAYSLEINNLKHWHKVAIDIDISGIRFKEILEYNNVPEPYVFTWDGRDAYGRPVSGRQKVVVRVEGNSYSPSDCFEFHDIYSDCGNSYTWNGMLGKETGQSALGGWTVDGHYKYDERGKVLHRGDGNERSAIDLLSPEMVALVRPQQLNDVKGSYDNRYMEEVTVGSDGSIYYLANPVLVYEGEYPIFTCFTKIMRVKPDGDFELVAGTGNPGYSGDGGDADVADICIQYRTYRDKEISISHDGSIYFWNLYWDFHPTLFRRLAYGIRQIRPDGTINTVAGSPQINLWEHPYYNWRDWYWYDNPSISDGVNARATIFPYGIGIGSIAAGVDGTLYFTSWNCALRVTGGRVYSATRCRFWNSDEKYSDPYIWNICRDYGVFATGHDGSFYCQQSNGRLYRIPPVGIPINIAGNGVFGPYEEGVPAEETSLGKLRDLKILADGTIYFIEGFRVGRIDTSGIIRTIVDTGVRRRFSNGGELSAMVNSSYAKAISLSSDQNLVVADGAYVASDPSEPLMFFQSWQMDLSNIPNLLNEERNILVVSKAGREIYEFNPQGRHLLTRDALTGAFLYEFNYDAGGFLNFITDRDGLITQFERDGNGDPTAIIAPYGQRTELSVDENGLLAIVRSPEGETYSMTYDEGGLLTGVVDPNGSEANFEYDEMGRLVKDSDSVNSEFPAGGFLEFARNPLELGYEINTASAEGRVAGFSIEKLFNWDLRQVSVDPAGLETFRDWKMDGSHARIFPDGMGSQISTISDSRFGMEAPLKDSSTISTPGGLTYTVEKERATELEEPENPASSVKTMTEITRVNGREYVSTYSGETGTWRDETPEGRIFSRVLDSKGRVIESQLGDLSPVDFFYRGDGKLEKVSQGGRETEYSYNSQGFLESITNALNEIVGFEYDIFGRVKKKILPNGSEIHFFYDLNGNLTSITPPGKPNHTFFYYPTGLPLYYQPPPIPGGGMLTQYLYNLDRELTQVIRPDGKTIMFGYHQTTGRLSNIASPRGIINYFYDSGTGNLSSIRNPDGNNLWFSYDGSLLKETTWTGEVNGKVSFAYNNDFQISEIAVNEESIAFSYDSDGLLVQAGALTIQRDAATGLVRELAVGVVRETFDHNSFGEMINEAAYTGSDVFVSSNYSRDALGRIKGLFAPGIVDADIDYDENGRIVKLKNYGVTFNSIVYDSNGNRLSLTSSSGTKYGTYDNQDRLLSYHEFEYTYNANGDLKTKHNIWNDELTRYEYDSFGNLRKVELPDGKVIEYVIDGLNRRIGKKINGSLVKGWLYKDQLNPVAELDGNGNLVSIFVYGAKSQVPDYMIKYGAVYRVVSNFLGSPRFTVMAMDGTLVQDIAYTFFGEVRYDTNPGFQPFGFAGGLYDPDTKLVRFGVRDYDGYVARWTTKDPILFNGGDTNLYGYVLNDPINFIDPDGESIVLALGIYFGVSLVYDIYQQMTYQPDPETPDTILESHAGSALIDIAGAGVYSAASELNPWCRWYKGAKGPGIGISKGKERAISIDLHRFKKGGKYIYRPHIDIPGLVKHWPW